MKQKFDNINQKLLAYNGEEEQLFVALEEMGELIQGISKYVRYGLTPEVKANLSKEIADVQFTLETLQEIFHNRSEVSKNMLEIIIQKTDELKE